MMVAVTWRLLIFAGVVLDGRVFGSESGAAPAASQRVGELLGLQTPEARMRAAIIGGALVVALVGWLVWRTRPEAAALDRVPARTSAPFGPDGVPSLEEIMTWSQPRLCAVIAALAETDGYEVERLPASDGPDLVLRRRGHPEVLVCCVPAAAGPVHGRRVRELDAMVTTAAAPAGWIVAPQGFASDAHKAARDGKIDLVDGVMFVEQLRALPPLLRPRVLAVAH